MIRFPSLVFRVLYRYLDKWDKHHELIFMNFGFSEPGVSISLDEIDKKTGILYSYIIIWLI
ncbi:MAG: hypothetical protein P1P83_14260 [Bacteroidales bacterium]|nr:hypothetical protein [Bacteroidales bacterium]MDT8402361.1 hypothetical protein [Bacteroidales bacterium]